jgi:hypothetical protein
VGLGIALIAAANAACPPLADGVESAMKALLDGADPQPGFAAAEASLACGPAPADRLAALWLARGAALHLAGDEAAAQPFYARARALAPEGFDERLGVAVKESWARASSAGTGRLIANRPLRIDGTRVSRFPTSTEAGPHALQAPEASWARVVVVPAGEDLNVEVPAPAKVAKKKSPLLAILGGVALAGAVGAGAGAISQTPVMEDAPDTTSLDAAWETQQVLGYSSIALAGLGATGVVLQFALP